jgi:hypothetical protein
VRGHECPFRHCIPTDEDERRVGVTHDVFGRERHKTDREDMGGVGSFSRENRTLYLGGLKPEKPSKEYETAVRKHFGEFGALEYVRVLPARGIGFVRYRLRTAAEFAKVAMADQSLDDDEVLNVRWAQVDPNPIAKAADDQAVAARFVKAVESAVSAMSPQELAQKEALRQLERLAANPDAHPDTDDDAQHPTGPHVTPAPGGIGPLGPPPQKRVAIEPAVTYRYTFANRPESARSDLPSGGGATAVQTAGGRQPWKHYQPNPDTGEFHPYAVGMIYPRQVAERPQETPEERDRRLRALEQHYDQIYQSAYASVSAASCQQPAAPIDPSQDEPGFHNDQPLI